MRVYFVRHGESEANVQHVITNRGHAYPLTEKGRAQAQALTEELTGAGITRIVSSPLLRAAQTAEILSAGLGLSYEVADALREFDCGVLEGRSDPASWEAHNRVWQDWFRRKRWDSRIEGGESLLDIRDRFMPFLNGVLAWGARRDERVILIGHGGLYLSMLPMTLANLDFELTASLPFPNTGYVLAETGPEGLTALEWCGVRLD